jgi:hypothetical protein
VELVEGITQHADFVTGFPFWVAALLGVVGIWSHALLSPSSILNFLQSFSPKWELVDWNSIELKSERQT